MEYDTYRMASTKTTLVVRAPGVLANDTDPDGDPLKAALLQRTVQRHPGVCAESGRFTYTPQPGFSGLEQFSYSARDNPQRRLCLHAATCTSASPGRRSLHDDSYVAL